jgi:hypothetical protein
VKEIDRRREEIRKDMDDAGEKLEKWVRMRKQEQSLKTLGIN